MTNTTTTDNYRYPRGYERYLEVDRPMTNQQRKTLVELISSCIDNHEEAERRLAEVDSFTFYDATEAIKDLCFSPYR